MNGYDIGGRSLVVNKADQEVGSDTRTPVPPPPSSSLPKAPIMPMAPTGTVSLDLINSTLTGMSNVQLLDVLSQMKVSNGGPST